jgi:uncharacterized protein (TIGR02271 family)
LFFETKVRNQKDIQIRCTRLALVKGASVISQTEIEDSEGEVATVYGLSNDESSLIARLENNQLIFVPISLLQVKNSERYSLIYSFGDLRDMHPNSDVIPVLEERLVIKKQKVQTSQIKIKKSVTESVKTVDEVLFKEEFDIQRVVLNEVRDEPAQMRIEAEWTFIPVQEEILVVQKKTLVTEEIRIRKIKSERTETRSLELKKENLTIDRKKIN